MSKHVIHAHSSVPGKIPSVSQLNYGEIAVNYASGSEALSIRNSDDEIVQIPFNLVSGGVGKVDSDSDGTGEIFNSYDTGANAATGSFSHAEGFATSATERSAHAEGSQVLAAGNFSHAEGNQTHAISYAAHSEGQFTYAMGNGSHAEGVGTSGIGASSHVEGLSTIAYNTAEHACGKYNFSIPESAASKYGGSIFTVGVGESANERKNAIMVDRSGGVYIYGLGRYDGTSTTGSTPTTGAITTPPMTISGVLSSIYDELLVQIQALQARIEQLTPLKYSLGEIIGRNSSVFQYNNFNTSGNLRKYESLLNTDEDIFDNIHAACQSGRPVIVTGVITGSSYTYNSSCTVDNIDATAACTVASYSYLSDEIPVLTLTLTLPPVEVMDCNTPNTSKTISTRTVAGFLILRRGGVATYYMADIG